MVYGRPRSTRPHGDGVIPAPPISVDMILHSARPVVVAYICGAFMIIVWSIVVYDSLWYAVGYCSCMSVGRRRHNRLTPDYLRRYRYRKLPSAGCLCRRR